MRKRVFSILIVALLIIGTFGLVASAAEDSKYPDPQPQAKYSQMVRMNGYQSCYGCGGSGGAGVADCICVINSYNDGNGYVLECYNGNTFYVEFK